MYVNLKLDLLIYNVYFIPADLQFPIDLSNVAKDHPFLENDPLQSLYRRLVALNRCATMRLDSAHKHGPNVSKQQQKQQQRRKHKKPPHSLFDYK